MVGPDAMLGITKKLPSAPTIKRKVMLMSFEEYQLLCIVWIGMVYLSLMGLWLYEVILLSQILHTL